MECVVGWELDMYVGRAIGSDSPKRGLAEALWARAGRGQACRRIEDGWMVVLCLLSLLNIRVRDGAGRQAGRQLNGIYWCCFEPSLLL